MSDLLPPAALARLKEMLAAREDAEAGADSIPARLGRYDLSGRLGEGAMAVVYRARDRDLGREVAIKILKGSALLSVVARERIAREAQALARLSHPNVIAVHDFGVEAGLVYVVMELASGPSLRQVLGSGMPGLRQGIGLLAAVARGVQHAHDRGIVHRDLKPENILVTGADVPKVVDFGLAHLADTAHALTRTGAQLGTPTYMAPEQVDGAAGPITVRTDVYALGAILYEVLTGRPPHEGASVTELFARILSRDPVAPRTLNPALPREVEAVILRAIEKAAGDRYAAAGELAEDLEAWLAGRPTRARPPGRLERIGRWARRNRTVATFSSLALAAVLAAAAVGWWSVERSRAERAKVIAALRDTERICLEAALRLRRAGETTGAGPFRAAIETAYRDAAARAPDAAEVEYLMGRMERALMDDAGALDHAERALAKDPRFAPALYERVVLLSKRYGRALWDASETLTWAQAAGRISAADPDQFEQMRPELRTLRQAITDTGERLESLSGSEGQVSSAAVFTARGIVACLRQRFQEGKDLLQRAVALDPLMEESWEALAQAALREAERAATPAEVDRLTGEAEDWFTKGRAHDRGYIPHLWGRAKVRSYRALYHSYRDRDPFGDYRSADDDLSDALRLDSTAWETWGRRGLVRINWGGFRREIGEDRTDELDSAQGDLDQAIRLNPKSPWLWLWRANLWQNRAFLSEKFRRDPSAEFAATERDLEEVLRLDPESIDARVVLGRTRYHLGYFHEARGDLRLAREEFARGAADFGEARRVIPGLGAWLDALVAEAKKRAYEPDNP
jgi:tetratricopeptide (TPR) repeat protein/tRNA A-37 threonylcarbamoyl transferase component Bud32